MYVLVVMCVHLSAWCKHQGGQSVSFQADTCQVHTYQHLRTQPFCHSKHLQNTFRSWFHWM